MAESVEELVNILRRQDVPMEKRIEAAAKLYNYYLAGAEVPPAIIEFARKSVDELKEIIDEEHYAKGTEEEAIVKGIFKAKVDRIKNRLKKAGLTEIARVYVSTKSNVEKEIAREMLKGKEEKLKEEASVLSAAAELMKAEAIAREAEFIKGNIPKISSPSDYRFLSDLQIKSVSKPTKYYATEAFKNGLWNLEWGDPKEYGIDVGSLVHYVSKPMNKDFARLMYSKGIWFFHWGNPEDYGVL